VKRLAERHAMNIRCTAQVVDVRIDGVSLAMNDRAQFNKISRNSFCATSIQRMGKME
jgi:ABC-type transporter MlaC component